MRRLALLLSIVQTLVMSACDEDAACTGQESLSVVVSGSCVAMPRSAFLIRDGCAVLLTGGSLVGPNGTAVATSVDGLPVSGWVDQARHPLRRGGWQVAGRVCVAGEAICQNPTAERLCTATRGQSALELVCIDTTGAEACRASITERPGVP